MTTFVAINPKSGNGSAARGWPALSERLREAVGDHEHAFAEGPGDVTRLVERAVSAGALRVVVLGGDGTINEAVNGLAGEDGTIRKGVTLGVVPLGRGSDFARGLGIPSDPAAAIARIAEGRERIIDVGRVGFRRDDGTAGARLFGNIASFGMSGLIDRQINAAPKRRFLPGTAAYYLATVRGLLRYRFQRVRVTVDSHTQIESDVALVAVANCRYFGGGMMIAPDAEPDDDTFDVVILRCTSKWVLLKDLRLVYGGRHRDHASITILRGRHIRAESAESDGVDPVLLDIDGEAPGSLPATFDIVPHALRVMC